MDGFPTDPVFPQLSFATDAGLMLDTFRQHLRPIEGKEYLLEDCLAYRFECRLSSPRGILQYTLRIAEPSTGRQGRLWVTGFLYADDREAKQHWREVSAGDPRQKVPSNSLTFEPVGLVPDLRMIVQVFPFDRRLPNLYPVMAGALRVLEPSLLARLGPGEWQVEGRSLEPTRYRTEFSAAFKYTIRAHLPLSAGSETLRSYLKVYSDDRGADTWYLLDSLAQRSEQGAPYFVIKPIAYLDRLRTLVTEEAPGQSLSRLLTQATNLEDVLPRVARAVAAFNQDDLPMLRRESLPDQLEGLRLASTLVSWACTAVRQRVQTISATIAKSLSQAPLAPIHGDLTPDHVFLSHGHVTFIDFDSAVLSDPVRDSAHLFANIAGGVGLNSMPFAEARAAADAFA